MGKYETVGSIINHNVPSSDSHNLGFPTLLKLLESVDRFGKLRKHNNESGRTVINEFK